jgi:hypothetical protein
MAFSFRCPVCGKAFRVGRMPASGGFICPHCNVPCVWGPDEAVAVTASAPETPRAAVPAVPERVRAAPVTAAGPETGGLPRVYWLIIIGAFLVAFVASVLLVALWFVSRPVARYEPAPRWQVEWEGPVD